MASIQNRTSEFQSILQTAARQQKLSSQRQSLLTPAEKQAANGGGGAVRQRSEFANHAATISKGISLTMERLSRLAALARNRSMFTDSSVEVSELTSVIKQSLSRLNTDLSGLQALSKQNPNKSQQDQVGKHNEGVVVLLRTRLGDVTSR
jgi:syntaxin 5